MNEEVLKQEFAKITVDAYGQGEADTITGLTELAQLLAPINGVGLTAYLLAFLEKYKSAGVMTKEEKLARALLP